MCVLPFLCLGLAFGCVYAPESPGLLCEAAVVFRGCCVGWHQPHPGGSGGSAGRVCAV